MKSVNSYLLKAAPKEIAIAIAAKERAFHDAIAHLDSPMMQLYSIQLKARERDLQRLAEKYGEFDQEGRMP